MAYENTRSGTENKTQCLDSDIISTLPQHITEKILTHMPIRDAVRTSVLSNKWRYTWRGMPKLVFTYDMVKRYCEKYISRIIVLKMLKFVDAISHVLSLHNGPTILEFKCSLCGLLIFSDFDKIILGYISRGNNVKELSFLITGHENYHRVLPRPFFSMQGLEYMELQNCYFEPPTTFNRFSRLRSLTFMCVEVSAQTLQQYFLSKCPMLEYVCLIGYEKNTDFVEEGTKFTFVDLLQCVPLVRTLEISEYYMKYLTAGGMPHKLPNSLGHLKNLFIDVYLMEQNEISSALCMIRSSPVLEQIIIMIYDNEKLPFQQTSTNFLDPDDYSDLKLDHLEILEIEKFRNLPIEMEFVKLIMAKSPMLKNVRIKLNDNVSVDEEVKMLRGLVLLPVPRASPSTKLIIERPETSL